MNFKAHLKRACESLLGSDDGKWIFGSVFGGIWRKMVM
jgi:hypothetical protein